MYAITHPSVKTDSIQDKYDARWRIVKKLLRSDELNMDIIVELDRDVEQVAASMISADRDKIDAQTLADYHAFIAEAILELEDHNLIILEKSESKTSETSKYFTLADLEQNVLGTMKFVIFLRISNHSPTEDEDVLQWIRKRRESTTRKLGVKWKVRDIRINDEIFTNYDDAVAYIGECAEKYQQSLHRR